MSKTKQTEPEVTYSSGDVFFAAFFTLVFSVMLSFIAVSTAYDWGKKFQIRVHNIQQCQFQGKVPIDDADGNVACIPKDSGTQILSFTPGDYDTGSSSIRWNTIIESK